MKSEQLKKLKIIYGILLGVALVGLIAGSFLFGMATYRSENNVEHNLFPIIAIVFTTGVAIPAAIAAVVGSKLKKGS